MRIFRALVALAALVHAAVLVARVISIVRVSAIMPVPIEGPGIYAIWRVQHGYPLYEWPTKPFFALTLYNFLFYKTYAWVLQLAGITGRELPLATHLVTLVFAVLGTIAQYVATTAVLRRLDIRYERWLIAALCFLIWLGAGAMGRWTLLARPDIAALAFAVAALALVITAMDGASLRPLVTASLVFFLAWAFKQSVVGILSGVCLFEAGVRRSVRRTAALALPFGTLCVVTLLAGGAAYRFNILEAPRISDAFIPWLAIYFYRSLAIPNLPVWLAAAVGVRYWARRSTASDPRWRDNVLTLLLCAIATTFPLDVLLLAKGGSAINHTFESWVVTALFAVVSFSLLFAVPVRTRLATALSTTSMMAPLVFGLLMLNGGPARALQAMTTVSGYDQPRFADEAEMRGRAALSERLKDLPKPLFIDDELFSEPWFATDGRYPAVVLDHVFYSAAVAFGQVDRDGVISLVDDRYFASLVVKQPPWLWTRHAVAAGYVQKETFLVGDTTWAAFVRSDTAPRKPIHSRRPTIRKTP